MYPEEYKMLRIEQQLKHSLNDGTTKEEQYSSHKEPGAIKLRFLKFLKVIRIGGPA